MRHVIILLGLCLGCGGNASTPPQPAPQPLPDQPEQSPPPSDSARPIQTIASGLSNPYHLHVSDAGIFWADENGASDFEGRGRILTWDADSKMVKVIAESEYDPHHILVIESTVYWLAYGAVRQSSISGGEAKDLWRLSGISFDTIVGDSRAVFWVQYETPRTQTIVRFDRASEERRVIDGIVGNPQLVLDSTYLYLASVSGLRRMERAGGPEETLLDRLAPGPDILLYDESLYYGDIAGGRLLKVAKTGGSAEELVTGLKLSRPVGLVVEGEHLYWLSKDAIFRAPLAGGEPEKIVDGQDSASSLAVYKGVLYWTNRGSNALRDGSLSSLAL